MHLDTDWAMPLRLPNAARCNTGSPWAIFAPRDLTGSASPSRGIEANVRSIAPSGRRRPVISLIGNFPAHTPSCRCQLERAIAVVSKQALAYARFELLAAFLRKRHDMGAPRSCPLRKRLPVVVE